MILDRFYGLTAGVGAYADRKPHAERVRVNNTVRETKTNESRIFKECGSTG